MQIMLQLPVPLHNDFHIVVVAMYKHLHIATLINLAIRHAFLLNGAAIAEKTKLSFSALAASSNNPATLVRAKNT